MKSPPERTIGFFAEQPQIRDVTAAFWSLWMSYTKTEWWGIEEKLIPFIHENRHHKIDFYCEEFIDFIHLPGLLEVALTHPYMTQRHDHNGKILFEMLASYGMYKSTCSESFDILVHFVMEKVQRTLFIPVSDVDVCHLFNPVTHFNELFDLHFANFPATELWRLFYDGVKQKTELGFVEYEKREPGFLKGMANAFAYLKESIHETLNLELLKKIHAYCTTGVNNLNQNGGPGIFRMEHTRGFGIIYRGPGSLAGMVELINKESSTLPHIFTYYNKGETTPAQILIKGVNPCYESIEKHVNETIAVYHDKMCQAQSPKAKLLAISQLIIDLEQIHPFGDANCRTICTLLTIRELMRNGFSPVILDDPNRMDAFSKEAGVSEMVNGMKNFLAVKHGNTSLFGKSTDEVLLEIDKLPDSQAFQKLWHDTLQLFLNHKIGAIPHTELEQEASRLRRMGFSN